jgi:hypothetical protein
MLKEERWLKVFENRILRRIFGPKRDEVTGEWRKLHNQELNDMYSSPSILVIKSRRWAEHVAHVGEGHVTRKEESRGVYRWGNLRERDHLEDPGMRRWKDIINVDLQEVGYEGMDWIDLAQDRDRWRAFVNGVMNLQVP